MTSKADQIRSLAREGHPVTEIAQRLDVRYQHAYNVCRQAGLITPSPPKFKPIAAPRSPLTVDRLVAGGFNLVGTWAVEGDKLNCPTDIPAGYGVYAFALAGRVVYVGIASQSLRKRLYFYGKPGPSQGTNIRLNEIIRQQAAAGVGVEIYVACPPNFEWNGFAVSGPEGLEAGMIREYLLPWNIRGTL